MLYRSSTLAQRKASRLAWEAWLVRVGRKSYKVRFALALMKFVEERVGSPQPHVASLMPEAMRVAAAAVPRPLTPAEVRDVLRALYEAWHHGLAMRNWAHQRGLMKKTD